MDASDLKLLKDKKVTHIVNTAKGIPCYFPNEFIYKHIEVDDIPTEDIQQYFDECYDFIRQAVQKGGIVFVHCFAGISRSSTIVMMFLMKRHSIFLQKTYEIIKKKRNIVNPNDGFMCQLEMYELKMIASQHKGKHNHIVKFK